MDRDDEAYILMLLSDGNLPTGSFVTSAGLESFVTHGFLTPVGTDGKQKDKLEGIVDFVRDSLANYARSALAFVSDAHQAVQTMAERMKPKTPNDQDQSTDDALIHDTTRQLMALDELYETITLNLVARRASRTQGVALLSLYSKGFTKPALLRNHPVTNGESSTSSSEMSFSSREDLMSTLIDKLKLTVRREETHGHLPICWGVLTAALGLSLERSQFLHLFLYARGLISAGVRMNTIGPYAAQQLLLHIIRPIVTTEAARCSHLRTGLSSTASNPDTDEVPLDDGPAMTWPLGEILAARHDLQHSRIFNS
ncbi:hypothetical protein NM688_g5361 [Phlebia brevispora]|uniref:Uncharacterized protein n=1 Tax=Phlebia brevispora TaxID=194682 RepID=A0ACC1SWK5_9APHY|nr:hypothetical protein NM688_g5361 [Phlebia brevispora]